MAATIPVAPVIWRAGLVNIKLERAQFTPKCTSLSNWYMQRSSPESITPSTEKKNFKDRVVVKIRL
jgi:hypothetical protein